MIGHGGVLKSLASSAREFERAASAVALAQTRKAEPKEGIAQMSVSWSRMKLAMEEIEAVVDSKNGGFPITALCCRDEVIAVEVGPAAVGLVASPVCPSKSERRAAREVVAAYHEARLAELVQRVGEGC